MSRPVSGAALSVVLSLLAVRFTCAQPAAATAGSFDLPAGVAALGPVTTQSSDRYRFESKSVGKPYIIEVVRIDSPFAPPNDAGMPVVFVTDNDAFSTLVPAIARSGALELFPSMLIVGIGYDTSAATSFAETLSQFGIRRAVDFTPTVDESYLAQVRAATGMLGQTWPEDARLGGADAFLSFIDDELKPFIAARYPANVDDAALVGHSLGGLFTLHVLFTSPESFDRYIALSPAANYGDGVLFREERALGDTDARVFVGLGDADVPQILESTPRLDKQIRETGRKGLRYTYKLFVGENHGSVVPGGVMTGLRAVFDPPPRPAFAPPAPTGGRGAER